MNIVEIIDSAIRSGASDVHITAGTPAIIRCAGELIRIGETKLMPDDTKALADEIFEYTNCKELFERRGEIDFSFSIPQRGRFRANIYKQRGSIAIALRLIPMEVPDISTLNIPDTIADLWQKQRGLVLVTGPTGAGKSTTLAAIINLINERLIRVGIVIF